MILAFLLYNIYNLLFVYFVKVYPKVKVRDEAAGEDDYTTSFHKALDSLSLHPCPSPPVKEHKDDSVPSVVRIPKSYVSNSIMPKAPATRTVMGIKSKQLEEEKPNIRASSVPRPRAVLSSPDNDGILKCQNKSREEIVAGLKNHNLRQNRHVQCKVIPRSMDAEGPPINKSRETNEAAHSRSNPKGIKGSASAEPSKRGYLRRQ